MTETCRLLASYANHVRFPSGSTVAISLLSASKTLVTALPRGLILSHGPTSCVEDRRGGIPSGSMVATALSAGSNTVVETNPSAFVVLTGLLAASNPKLVRFPSASTVATTRLALS